MKTLLTVLAATTAFAAPALADGHATSVEAFFAMSNNSAAEILLQDTSMGDVNAAEMRFALGNMSAAERMGFFEADMATKRQILAAQKKLQDDDSAAESN